MPSRLTRTLVLGVVTTLFSTGCMLSRLVDKSFLGISFKAPTYVDRKTTGIFLLPFTFALDIATFPIQALLVVILGDDFPFHDTGPATSLVAMNLEFQKLSSDRKAAALAELDVLLNNQQLTANSVLALGPEGHWLISEVSNEAKQQLIARSQAPFETPVAVCAR